MYNKKSFASVESKKLSSYFSFVDEDYNLAYIPNTVLSNFGVKTKKTLPLDVMGDKKRYKKVLLFVIDAFGYEAYEKYFHHSSFLKKATTEGIVSKLTTQFPTTTSSNITTFHTALPVSQSGVIEWFYYEPYLDNIFSPLIYREVGCSEVLNVEASKILPETNIYQQLNVNSYVFQYNLFNNGPYAKWIMRGSNLIDFESISEGFNKLKTILSQDELAYYYFYISDYDEACHDYGPNSSEANNCLMNIFKDIDDFFDDSHNLKDTLILITADHGQTTVNKDKAIYLNLEYPEILPFIKKNKLGNYLVPCGSFRDMFLHIEKDALNDVYNFLKKKLELKAEVYLVDDLIKLGLFGKEKLGKRFLDRVADIVILPYIDEAVWWYEENKFFVKHKGMHGGLTKSELEIPFIVYKKM